MLFIDSFAEQLGVLLFVCLFGCCCCCCCYRCLQPKTMLLQPPTIAEIAAVIDNKQKRSAFVCKH